MRGLGRHRMPVKATVAKEKLFMEVTQRINSDKSKNNVQLREQEDAEALIAMVLTQVFRLHDLVRSCLWLREPLDDSGKRPY